MQPDARGRFPVGEYDTDNTPGLGAQIGGKTVGTNPSGQGTGNIGMMTRSLDDRNWSIQQYTGYPTANTTAGQWNRGILMRQNSVEVRLPRDHWMYDPTDPSTWHQSQH